MGAIGELTKAAVTYERISVPGALEIPQALAAVVDANDAQSWAFDGAIALVIRGETAHFDIVCNVANHWLMEIAVRQGIPVGNGILTVDSKEQALERATDATGGKGADAARACSNLIRLRKKLQLG
jgi:6,7-dimethyl-8-ribityllumazine synthase